MSKDFGIELNGAADRRNRFQVNPVKTTSKSINDYAESEPFEEDTFNDDDIVLRNNRRSSR